VEAPCAKTACATEM